MSETVSPKTFSCALNFVVYAPPEKVFDALTKEGIIGEWCDGGGKVDPKVNGNIEMFGDWVKGTVIKFNRNTKELSYTWKPAEWDKRTQPSIVNFVFAKHPAGTLLKIEHTHFPSREEASNHENGWTDYVLDPLNDYFTEKFNSK
jgi:uncharacterized protein YndB with AHSA1/START domain